MNSYPKLSYAIATILSGYGMGMGISHAATEADASNSEGIQEVVVTAQRRSESIQNVPITIQAITGDQLKQLNVVNFNDLLKYTPNVTFSGNGPGTGNIFIRGLGLVGSGNQSQSTTSPFPNVALYLDDQSMQFPARNVDVYLVDMERVEVLEGPQGTLFGGGAQAGAIRYITNKPKLGVTEGAANAAYGVTAGGDPNNSANLTFNLPVGDNLALRGVIFNEHQGGYISNVPDSIAVPPVTVPGGPPLRPGSPPATNSGITGDNLNTVQYGGARLSALYKVNDNWDVLLQQNYQRMDSEGYFYEYPLDPNGTPLGNHEITAFKPAFSKDDYESTAWTVNGHVADLLKVVYTGSYMVRHIDGQQDYSNYIRSRHGSYYACSGAGAGYAYFRSAKPTTCYAPVGSWRDQVRNTHVSHEFRVSTNEDYRLRGLVGAFWEKFALYDNMNFNYMSIPQCSPQNLAISAAGGPDCVTAVGPVLPGYFVVGSPGYRTNTNTAFGENDLRGYNQLAFFGSVDFDIVPKVLTVTAGTRHYKYDEFEHGSEYYSATSTVLNVPNGTCTHCGFGMNLNKSESGFKSRANITWHVTPDIMGYYTWSQGFRPGGFNRTKTSVDGSVITLKGVAPLTAGAKDFQFDKPAGYNSDNLVNNELGFKSEFFSHRLQLNASLYQMDWSGVQLPLFDPVHLGNTTFVVNGPTYRVRGLELQAIARLFEGFTVQGSSSWNASEQTDAPCLASNRPGSPIPAGQCITTIRGVAYPNPYGVLGTRPPFSPALEFNLRARYDWLMQGGYNNFVSIGASHIGSQSNEPASFPDGNDPAQNPPTTTLLRYQIPGYTTYDAQIGTTKDNWTVQLSGSNLGNSDAATNVSSGQFIKSEVPIRPRVIMFGVGYKF